MLVQVHQLHQCALLAMGPSRTMFVCLEPARYRDMQARDAFYACVREQGVEFAPGTKPPARCTRLRQQFEGACPASWVRLPLQHL